MALLDCVKDMFSKTGVELPAELPDTQALTDKVQETISQHTENLDQLKETIPGNFDDGAIDAIKERFGQK